MNLPAPPRPGDERFDRAACGLLIAELDGTVREANQTLLGWLGLGGHELVGRRIQDFFSIGGRLFHQTHCVPLLQMQASVAELQIDMLRKDGVRLPMLINIVRERRPDDCFDAFAIFLATDRRSYERELLAARKSAEAELDARLDAEEKLLALNQQLFAADRRKDEFLATLAHELRNPLAPMRNIVTVLTQQLAADDNHASSLKILDRQLAHLTHLVDDLMEISRVTQGVVELRRLPVDLRAIVHQVMQDLGDAVGSAGLLVTLGLPAAPVVVDADATRLSQVVANLLTNAIKYTPTGGKIWLDVATSDDEIRLSVRDTGIGIPAESLGTIFDMFSQLKPALERAQGGLGIGLALVRGLVTLHGGSIEATSAGIGQGSEFTVSLPRALSEAGSAMSDAPLEFSSTMAAVSVPALAPLAPEAAAAPAPYRILIVDDNVDAADTMVMAMEMFGYDPRPAYSGTQALRSGDAFEPHVVLLDIGLPDLNGYEVARRIRDTRWGRCALLVAATGWGQAADRQLAREAGFDHHMTKPVNFDALQTLIRASLAS
jgi:signal transduction histidine kinase